MKRTLLLTAFSALLLSNTSQAQIPGVSKVTKALPKVDLGLKIGANFQQTTGINWDNAYKAGITGGAFVGVYKNKIGVQAEGLIKSAKMGMQFYSTGSGPVLTADVKTVSLDIPVLFEYKIIPRLWIQLGPQFTTILSAKSSIISSSGNDVKNYFKSSEFSGVLGLQAKLPVHLVVGARYIYGFTDINNNSTFSTNKSTNRTAQVYLGFRFL
jgi:hypothetical protein